MKGLFRKGVSKVRSLVSTCGWKLNPERRAKCVSFVISALFIGCLVGARRALAQTEPGEISDDAIAKAASTILTLIQGAFGALVAICAGLGAILASAFGQYRAALSCLIVAVGAFILQNFVEMFFNMESIQQFLNP